MGKAKRRKGLHQAPIKAHKKETDHKQEVNTVNEEQMPTQITQQSILPTENIFKDIDIQSVVLKNQKLPDFDDIDARSIITSKTFKELKLKKKEKMKLKKEFWMKKMNAVEVYRNEEREKKKRENSVITGDMRPLQDTLPTLELLMKKTTASDRPNVARPKGIQTEKKRKKQMMADIDVFKQVLGHPVYKAAPKTTIKEHLQARLEQEAME